MSRAGPLLVGWMLAALVAGSGAAGAAGCDTPAGTGDPVVVRGAANVAAIAADQPARLWIGPDDAAPGGRLVLAAPALRRLQLAPGSVLAGITVRGGTLAGWHAAGVRFEAVALTGVDLSRAELSEACFAGGSLAHSDLGNAHLAGTHLADVDLAGTRLAGADLTRASISCSAEDETACARSLGGLVLVDANLTEAEIGEVAGRLDTDFTDAVLDRTQLRLAPGLFARLADSRVASVRLAPPEGRLGPPEPFTGTELRRLGELGAGDPYRLIERMAPSGIDCRKTDRPVEQAICRSADLVALDRLLTLTLDRLGQPAPPDPAFQIRRDGCARPPSGVDGACLAEAYLARLTELGVQLADRVHDELATTRHLYRAAPIVAIPAVRDDPLVGRLIRAFGRHPEEATASAAGPAIALILGSADPDNPCAFDAVVSFDAAGKVWRDPTDPDATAWAILPDGIVSAGSVASAARACAQVYFRTE